MYPYLEYQMTVQLLYFNKFKVDIFSDTKVSQEQIRCKLDNLNWLSFPKQVAHYISAIFLAVNYNKSDDNEKVLYFIQKLKLQFIIFMFSF